MGYQRGALVDDTYTDTSYGNLAFASGVLTYLGANSRWIWYGVLPSFVPRGGTVSAGRLSFFTKNIIPAGTYTFTITPVSGGWWTSRLSSNNAATSVTLVSGAALTRTVTKAAQTSAGDRWDVDIAPILQAIADGAGYTGVQVKLTNGSISLAIHSVQSTLKPYVDVTWADVPEVPATLSPGGGRYVGAAQPIFRAAFNDFGGTTRCSGMQVQVSASSSFTSPLWDSGQVVTAAAQIDSAGTAFSAPVDVLRYWRARVQNQAGTWSGWSAPESFRYYPLPVPQIVSPAGTTVEDATPPVILSLASGTASLWQVVVYDELTLRPLWAREWAPMSSPYTLTIPAGVIQDSTTRYRIAAQVRDSRSREAIPGAAVYGEATRVVTYTPTATVTDSAAPVATRPVPAQPMVKLTWTRGSAPDGWVIVRNDSVIGTPSYADTWVSGTTYTWTDYGVPPQSDLTYKVRAVVNGKSSLGASVTVAPLRPKGVWLVDVAGELDPVVLYGEDQGTWTMPDASQWVTPLGAAHSVLVSADRRGYEGSFSGDIVDRPMPMPTMRSADMRRRMLRLRQYPGRPLWLIVQDLAIKVVVSQVTVAPTPSPELIYRASFEFRQTP